MLAIIPDPIRRAPREYREKAAVFRSVNPASAEAAALESCAKDLEERMREAEEASRELTSNEYARLRGVQPGTVRKWCARGELAGAYQTEGGDWRIPSSARRSGRRKAS